MKKVSVIGYGTTQFGELWERSLFDLAEDAINGALQQARLTIKDIDAIFFGNMLGGILENNIHSGATLAEVLGVSIPIFRAEAACASGGVAFHLAHSYLKAGSAKTVLVVGAEKMTDYPTEVVVSALAGAASGQEQGSGLTFAGLYALMARAYMNTYNYSEEDLAAISVKNHAHGTLNPSAHFRKDISIADVMASQYVAAPIKVLDASPISDGAAAIVLTIDENILSSKNTKNNKKSKKGLPAAIVTATEVATDAISLSRRSSLTSIAATKIASRRAFATAGLKPADIHVAEVHDCFSIAEVMAMEDLGFWKFGTGGAMARSMATLAPQLKTNHDQEAKSADGIKSKDSKKPSSHLVINTSGGLKASGHPVGATGIKQIGEIFLQLTGQADKRQVVGARHGLAHNVGGSGGTAVVTILTAQTL